MSATPTPTATTTTSSISSAPNTGAYATPPAPTQTSIIPSCNLYAIAQNGDGCYQFAARYGLTLTQLCKSHRTSLFEIASCWLTFAQMTGTLPSTTPVTSK